MGKERGTFSHYVRLIGVQASKMKSPISEKYGIFIRIIPISPVLHFHGVIYTTFPLVKESSDLMLYNLCKPASTVRG